MRATIKACFLKSLIYMRTQQRRFAFAAQDDDAFWTGTFLDQNRRIFNAVAVKITVQSARIDVAGRHDVAFVGFLCIRKIKRIFVCVFYLMPAHARPLTRSGPVTRSVFDGL